MFSLDVSDTQDNEEVSSNGQYISVMKGISGTCWIALAVSLKSFSNLFLLLINI